MFMHASVSEIDAVETKSVTEKCEHVRNKFVKMTKKT